MARMVSHSQAQRDAAFDMLVAFPKPLVVHTCHSHTEDGMTCYTRRDLGMMSGIDMICSLWHSVGNGSIKLGSPQCTI